MRAFVREQLGAIPLFHGVDPDTYEAMLPLFDCLDVEAAGADIIVEGVLPPFLCILCHGAVSIILRNGL